MTMWNEQNLRADIVAKWGEHGAHADLFDTLLTRITELEAALDATQLRSIEARNPGINMNEVRASRESAADYYDDLATEGTDTDD